MLTGLCAKIAEYYYNLKHISHNSVHERLRTRLSFDLSSTMQLLELY
jgi:hypothetical protein